EVDPDMGAYTVRQLLKRNLDIRLGARLESCVDGVVKLNDGDSFSADTIVWTAGVKPHPMLDRTDLPRDDKQRLTCLPTLQVVDAQGQVVAGAGGGRGCGAGPHPTAEQPGGLGSPGAPPAGRPARRVGGHTARGGGGEQPA